MGKDIRVVHYLNQFFGGIGGEEMADVAPEKHEGCLGPGGAIDEVLEGQGKVVGTVTCGDNYFADHEEKALSEVLRAIKDFRPDIVIAGPAYNAGRFGAACGAICKAAQEELSLPAVAGMFEENPGVDQYHSDIYIVSSGDKVRYTKKVLSKMVDIAVRLYKKEPIGKPAEEGYFPRNIIVNVLTEKKASDRAVEMLLAKIKGEEFTPELELPKFDRIPPSALGKPLKAARIALATDGGLVLKGNPEERPRSRSTTFSVYQVKDSENLDSEHFQANHGGYHTVFVDKDPNRLVPLDAIRAFKEQGLIGEVHDKVYATAGVATSLANCKKIGEEMAAVIQSDGVDAVILTST